MGVHHWVKKASAFSLPIGLLLELFLCCPLSHWASFMFGERWETQAGSRSIAPSPFFLISFGDQVQECLLGLIFKKKKRGGEVLFKISEAKGRKSKTHLK